MRTLKNAFKGLRVTRKHHTHFRASSVIVMASQDKPSNICSESERNVMMGVELFDQGWFVCGQTLGNRTYQEDLFYNCSVKLEGIFAQRSWSVSVKQIIQQQFFSDGEELHILALFDGHGGVQVARHVKTMLPDLIVQKFNELPLESRNNEEEIGRALKRAFLE